MEKLDEGLSLSERALLLDFLAWSSDTVEVKGGPPQTAWEVSLSLVLDDVLGGHAVCGDIKPRLLAWCAAQESPEQKALSLSTLAVYVDAPDEVVGALSVFTGLALV